ncbi:glutamyl-tRNA reductase [Arcticibacter tournemirensis]|uniref:Glutamyl-tRNA reductase n=1 Tax=Arcticibacter tournemirensis TaxID=699437 RepID=A0A4V1KIP1_9SPHI|nr:glutamyl-tRNA reductase [Arcticibacter tournemirensis]KAA8482264.1 glutamyl-tRNA reductase [Arcticibacter tournemirensis]RXF71372.1 glutamyl-tRNA reductase [Arcticibacter tournemirensis]TQM52404.1 glutamyl-tRNA reductase [Arcticibacter tournemirensis]
MKQLKVLAFTHQQIDLKDLGKFVICNQTLAVRLNSVREKFDIPEIFYIGTCNRVEFVFSGSMHITPAFVKDFIQTLDFCIPDDKLDDFVSKVRLFEDVDAFNHLLRVSCSLESLVVGEKEILAQVRKGYETCREAGFTGDYMRLIMSHIVKTAKEVYTETKISKNPVSVVSLAYRKLRDLNMCSNSRILIIGAGETNKCISKYLQKHKYSNFAVFNRTLSKAEELAKELNGEAFSITELINYKKGFDVIITCTSAVEPIITNEIYHSLLNGETDKKVIVDLAIPNDTHPEILERNPVHFIEVRSLQEIANQNMQERYQELVHAEVIIEQNINEFKPILKQRQIELAMREVPLKIKEIRRVAVNSVFADDIQQLDSNSREVLERVINYMEKKYISVPMVMAKEILVNNS